MVCGRGTLNVSGRKKAVRLDATERVPRMIYGKNLKYTSIETGRKFRCSEKVLTLQLLVYKALYSTHLVGTKKVQRCSLLGKVCCMTLLQCSGALSGKAQLRRHTWSWIQPSQQIYPTFPERQPSMINLEEGSHQSLKCGMIFQHFNFLLMWSFIWI